MRVKRGVPARAKHKKILKAAKGMQHSRTRSFRLAKQGVIKVIPTSAQWFGVTYKEDAPVVQKSLNQLVDSGAYAKSIWES